MNAVSGQIAMLTSGIMDFRSFIKWYWNPLLLSAGLCGYIANIIAGSTIDVEPGTGTAGLLILAALPFVSILWAWLVALLQAGWGIRCLVKNQMSSGKHNIISAVWVAVCYTTWTWLVSQGYVLLA